MYSDGTVPGGNTIANTNAETAFASAYTAAGGSLAVGNVVRIKLWGTYGTALIAPTMTGKVKLGSTTVLNTGAITAVAGLSNAGWMAEGYFVVTAIGASGSVECQGYASFATAATAALSVHVDNASPFSVDTTSGLALAATVQWSTASASNTITLRIMTVEILR